MVKESVRVSIIYMCFFIFFLAVYLFQWIFPILNKKKKQDKESG